MLDKTHNRHNHFLSFGTIVENAREERRKINIRNIARYGIKILDDYLGGISSSELVVIGADTGIGKSELAYIIALHNANRGKKVLFFGLEGDLNEFALRYLQKEISESGYPIKTIDFRFNLNKNIYSTEDYVIEKIPVNIKNNLLIFNKREIPTLSFIKNIITQAQEGVDMIIIDHLHYIQLMREDELRETGEIMRALKTITDIIKKPIILISHIRKREIKHRDNDPIVADLYGSSNIGKEATTILLITKMRIEDMDLIPGELPAEDLDNIYGGTKIIVAKSRIGVPLSSFALLYDRQGKKYMEQFQWLIEDESGIRKDEKIIDLDSIEI